MTIPGNIQLSTLTLTPAELPGSGRFWAVYEHLDTGPVGHVRYVGLLLLREGESADDAVSRAAALRGGQE